MAFDVLPTKTDDSLGRPKTDRIVRPKLDRNHEVPAVEWERMKDAIITAAEFVGTTDGRSPGALTGLIERVNAPGGGFRTYSFFDDFELLVADRWTQGGVIDVIDATEAPASGAGFGWLRLDASLAASSVVGRLLFRAAIDPVFQTEIRTPADLDGASLEVGFENGGARLVAGTEGSNWTLSATSTSGGGTATLVGETGLEPDTTYIVRIELEHGTEARLFIDGQPETTISDGSAVPDDEVLATVLRGLPTGAGGVLHVDWLEVLGER